MGGAIGGLLLGASLAGPPGAIFGGLGGFLLANNVNKVDSAKKKRAFISFDYDHDLNLKTLLVGQSKHNDTPFEIIDVSLRKAISNDWKKSASARINNCDIVIVICGEYTHLAAGVSTELEIAQESSIPYFLLAGYTDRLCKMPIGAKNSDKAYVWTWDNLRILINGGR